MSDQDDDSKAKKPWPHFGLGLDHRLPEDRVARLKELKPFKGGKEAADVDVAFDIMSEYVRAHCSEQSLADAIEKRQPLSTRTVIALMVLGASQEGWSESANVSRRASRSAASKGKIWKQAAIERWREQGCEFKYLSHFCDDIAKMPLTTSDGQQVTLPAFRTVYDFMREERKQGRLGD